MARALAPENPSNRRLSIAASTSAWRVACGAVPDRAGLLAFPALAMPEHPIHRVERLLKSYAQDGRLSSSGYSATDIHTHGELGEAGLRGWPRPVGQNGR